MIEQQVTKTVEAIVKDTLSQYSPFGKALKESIEHAVGADLRGLALEGYNDFVLKIVKTKLDRFYDQQARDVIGKAMDEMLQSPPASMKLSELVDAMKKHVIERESDHDSECTVHVEHDGSFTWIALDPKAHVEKYRCAYRFHVFQGCAGGLRIEGREVEKTLFVGPLYSFERLLFQLHVNKTPVEIDDYDRDYPSDYD